MNVDIVEQFERFAADFEAAVDDDDWQRLARYFAEDATYLNVGGPDPRCEGRDAILAYFARDVAQSDRRFDSRTLTSLAPPDTDGNRLSRRWRCTFTLAGAPDLVLEGESRYLFDGSLIKDLETQLSKASLNTFEEWMRGYGDRLPDADRR